MVLLLNTTPEVEESPGMVCTIIITDHLNSSFSDVGLECLDLHADAGRSDNMDEALEITR